MMAMFEKRSYFIKAEGPDRGTVAKAFRWLLENSKAKSFLAIAVIGNLNGVIGDVLGERIVKALRKEGKVAISGIEIVLVTKRNIIYDGENAPLLAFYPSSKYLDELDSIPNISAMLVVPWTMKDIELWIRARNATEVGVVQPPKELPLVSNKVVEAALRSLTARVNVSTGIAHPMDREATIQALMILRDAGERFVPDEIKAWLISKGGWRATDAQEVAEVAQKILDGRRLRYGASAWALNILEIWREEARQLSGSSE